jgi:hypothetical protein
MSTGKLRPRRIGIRIPAEARDIFLLQNAQTGPGTRPVSTGIHSLGKSGRDVKLTNPFMAWTATLPIRRCNAIYGHRDKVKVTAFGQVTPCKFMENGGSESFSASLFKV